MCDTLVALPAATQDGSTILAKNSDREPNEAQLICRYPHHVYPSGATVQCTYISIPQARETHSVLLSRPFWMWGAEMGANEHGLVIGNEAIFAKVKVPATGLTGMDLLRLALERAATARDAVDVITSLLAEHGQGGSGGYRQPFFYHNSFLIADRREGWVLETVDRQWAAQRVRSVRSISNGITIGRDFDLASPGLVSYAVQQGWCAGPDDFDFARCYSSDLYTRFWQCQVRQPHTIAGLQMRAGQITPAAMMALLRSHGDDPADQPFDPAHSSNGSICMHYAGNLVRTAQTTGSLVAHLRPDGTATFWLTGTSAPCLSLFKPFYMDGEFPDLGPEPTGQYDPASLWWQGERLHRATLEDYPTRARTFVASRDALEAGFIAGEAACREAPAGERAAFSRECVRRADRALAEWTARVESVPATQRKHPLYHRRWQEQSAAAALGVSLLSRTYPLSGER